MQERAYGINTKTIEFDFSRPYSEYDEVKKGLVGLEIGILCKMGLMIFYEMLIAFRSHSVNNVGIGVDILRLTETPDCEEVCKCLRKY